MPEVSLFFQVHQPFRLHPFKFFDIGSGQEYFNENLNKEILDQVAERCYLPANELLLNLLEELPDLTLTFSISGMALEQFEAYRPDILESFRNLVATGRVHLLAETYYHSLSYFYNKREFARQVIKHTEAVKKHFGYTTEWFRNTELACTNGLIEVIDEMGYKGLITEGLDWIIPATAGHVNSLFDSKSKALVLLRNHHRSNDIGYRFADQTWNKYPLTVRKFTNWLGKEPGEVVNIYMDYEAIGEHHDASTGIFTFLQDFCRKWHGSGGFTYPSEVARKLKATAPVDIYSPISWADTERDLSAWSGNPLQKAALKRLYELGQSLVKAGNEELLDTWAKLQTSDHFYYMSTKSKDDGRVHAYFSPYPTPYDAYVYYMNVLADFELRLQS